MSKADSLRAYIAQKQQQIDDLIFTYGDGVRPAWVGEEIGMITAYKQEAEKKLQALENKDAH